MVICSSPTTHAFPTFTDIKSTHRPSDITLTDRRGAPIQTVRIDPTVRRLPWVTLNDVSPALLHALVLSEDRRFYEHSGVDWSAVATSAWANAWNTRTRGASTLTMQLAGLLDDDLARPVGGRSVAGKLSQAWVAHRLEANWTKAQILEAYLNRVGWRGELVGLNALSQTLFGKWSSGLDAQESAVAVALLRGPNAGPSTVAQRACGVLQLQKRTCQGVTALAQNALARSGGAAMGEQIAPHFARQWLARVGGSGKTEATLRTSLDARVQRVAVAQLRARLAELSSRSVEDGALVVLDNASGEILAWVGSSGDLSDARQVDGVIARRQPGSTLKPFVYELAFERRLITPATLIDDSPAQIATAAGLYLPQNYDRDFKGFVSARSALGGSLNIPAVRVGLMLGPDAVFERLNAYGLELPQNGGYYGPSIALGSADVTLLALANAYRTLANGGQWSPVRWPNEKPAPLRRVADARAVFLTTDILADNAARARTFGLDSVLATRGFAAVKTGTSKDMRDNWCVGFTSDYTIAVWVGNASGAPMHGVSGTSGAAPVWQAIVKTLHANVVSKPARAIPAGVVQASVRFDDEREPARPEWFIAGTEPQAATVRSVRDSAPPSGIVAPRDGTIFALDPDIPPRQQRITFEGERGSWSVDGRSVGRGTQIAWLPWPGRHRLTLQPAGDVPAVHVDFDVRGAVLAASAPAAQTRKR